MRETDEHRRGLIETGREEGWLYRLLPRHDVFAFSPSKPTGERFATLFAGTWRRLPIHVRRRILGHWGRRRVPLVTLYPQIEVLDTWAQSGDSPGTDGTKAAVFCRGYKLAFCAAVLDTYTDDLVGDLIAHELAHVFQWASGLDANAMCPVECESDADSLIENWGFSPDAMDRYDLEQGLVVVPDLDKMIPSERDPYMRRQRSLLLENGR